MILAILILFVSAANGQDGYRPMPGPPMRSLVDTLRLSGSHKTLIIVIGKVGLENVGPNEDFTLFAPTDSAFAKLLKKQLDALMKNPAKLKQLLWLHTVKGRVSIADLLVSVNDGTSKTFKELKSLEGRVLGFSCDGHTGEHHPRINGGTGQIGKGDISFSRGVIHEVDEVMASDYLFTSAGPGGGPKIVPRKQ